MVDPKTTEGGPLVARKRPTTSDVSRPALTLLDGGKPDDLPLTPAETRAATRSATLTHAQLKRHFTPGGEPPLRKV
jgi:hypothetical protein